MAARPDDGIARGFPPTRHSALAAIREGDAAARRQGLEILAAAYWRPVYGYIRLGWGIGHEDAADLTQEFFAELLRQDLLARFDPARARLRTFLRLCVDGLVANQRKAGRRLKRGGGEAPLSLDFSDAPNLDTALSPEALFEKEWARGLFTIALSRLAARCEREEKTQNYALFELYELGAEAERPSYDALARRHGIAVTDVTNRLAWVRRELRKEVLALLREATGSEEELRAEARALLGIEAP